MTAAFEQPGWPRPMGLYDPTETRGDRGEPRMMPVPWVVAVSDGQPDWTVFHDGSERAHYDRLCQVCGTQLNRVIVLVAHGYERRETSGPGCHPRCAALAVKLCPHVDGMVTVPYRYEGEGLGYGLKYRDSGGMPYQNENRVDASATPMSREDVVELAKMDAMGVGDG